MSEKIDWRQLTRNFLRGEADENDVSEHEDVNAQLLTEAADRRLMIKHEASRLRNTFNHAEIELLITEIKNI